MTRMSILNKLISMLKICQFNTCRRGGKKLQHPMYSDSPSYLYSTVHLNVICLRCCSCSLFNVSTVRLLCHLKRGWAIINQLSGKHSSKFLLTTGGITFSAEDTFIAKPDMHDHKSHCTSSQRRRWTPLAVSKKKQIDFFIGKHLH